MAILLYFDTNVLCRPFDDQTIRRFGGRPKPLNVNINNKDRTLEVMNPEDFIAKVGW